jgi:hypothetical protein
MMEKEATRTSQVRSHFPVSGIYKTFGTHYREKQSAKPGVQWLKKCVVSFCVVRL